jgi:hypothetical protein
MIIKVCPANSPNSSTVTKTIFSQMLEKRCAELISSPYTWRNHSIHQYITVRRDFRDTTEEYVDSGSIFFVTSPKATHLARL